jgi:hypothetical protein
MYSYRENAQNNIVCTAAYKSFICLTGTLTHYLSRKFPNFLKSNQKFRIHGQKIYTTILCYLRK